MRFGFLRSCPDDQADQGTALPLQPPFPLQTQPAHCSQCGILTRRYVACSSKKHVFCTTPNPESGVSLFRAPGGSLFRQSCFQHKQTWVDSYRSGATSVV